MTLFKTVVKDIGPEASAFKEENMLILFGEDAPATLKDYCYNIEVHPSTGDIKEGMTVNFDDQHYTITAVGNKVKKNLDDLGHITIKFDGATEPELPGTLYVEAKTYPELAIGTTVTID